MKKVLLLTTALAFVGSNAFSATSEFTCPEGSASTLHCFTCGSNCTMTLDTATGHAIVEGKGDMEGGNPWNKYNSSFKSVEIKEGITSVGTRAFMGADNLLDVIIPNTVTKIESAAFCDAHILASLNIPDSVTSIGEWAFDRTYALKELVIPDSVTELGYGAFWAAGIQSLTIPDHLILAHIEPTIQDARDYKYSTFGGATNIICAGSGDTEKCDALLQQIGKNIQSTSRPNYKIDENGNIVERYQYDENGNKYTTATYEYDESGKIIEHLVDGRIYEYDANWNLLKYTLKNADGSTYIYNKDGNLVGIKGKKIYTVEEAEAVTAHGDKFHVSLTYK